MERESICWVSGLLNFEEEEELWSWSRKGLSLSLSRTPRRKTSICKVLVHNQGLSTPCAMWVWGGILGPWAIFLKSQFMGGRECLVGPFDKKKFKLFFRENFQNVPQTLSSMFYHSSNFQKNQIYFQTLFSLFKLTPSVLIR